MASKPASWDRLLDALDSGNIEQIRSAVGALDARGEELLSEHIGGARVERARRTVRRSRETQRRATGGRVIVIHGIMGAQLDVVDKKGDSDRVWVKYLRLLNGRIRDLELRNGNEPKDPSISVRVAGIFPEYVPMLLELDQIWKVSPFAYDWRLDIDDAAAKLADLVKFWAAGQPCHIVAHSMGGLVARRFMQLFPDVWKTMVDANGRKRGGRLIQLGTPNRGSFAIPLMLTGNEPLVRKLAFLDRKHDVKELVSVLATFPGPYQMMPAPSSGSGTDERNKLYQLATWGAMRPVKEFLDRGSSFHKAMENIVDPEGIVYVAGYDQETPYRVTVTKPGAFEYEITTNGDGRVPHDLGLLEGVRTLWVDEVHGDLAGNESVLSGIHGLLETGNTVELEQSLPASRRRADPQATIKAIPEDAAEVEFKQITAAGVPARGRKPLDVPANAERAEALLVRGFVGSPTKRSVEAEMISEVERVERDRPARKTLKPVKLRMQIICGDIRKVRGDVYAVGHYIGVMPQAAEAALDTVVSAPDALPHARVLNAHTRLRLLRGELGTVKFFPWADGSGRLVAVAGMGHPGTFGAAELRKLASSLTLEVGALPNVKTICTVLIGSGVGNLAVSTCVRRLLLGVVDALRFERGESKIDAIKIVERDFGKAHEIHEAVERFTTDRSTAETLDIDLSPVEIDASAEANWQLVAPNALANLAFAAKPGSRSSARTSLDELLRNVPGAAKRKVDGLAKIIPSDAKSAEELASRLTIAVRPLGEQQDARSNPTRLSFVRDRDELVTAALSNTAVVPQRVLRFDLTLFDELALKATDPLEKDADDIGLLITRLLISSDFMPLIAHGAGLVAELDRYTAGLPWELLATNETLDGRPKPLALEKDFARQLRTTYSPAPATPIGRDKLRVLVIGDPGDPRQGDDLPGARAEALAVYEYLHDRGVDVEARIGAPSAQKQRRRDRFEPAARLEVLKLLLSGDYDLVHYCGHGDFDEKDPTTTGWLFEGGLLRAHEIERIQRAPRLIVANACLSGRVSERRQNGKPVRRPGEETALLPSLADEFFRRGVRDYVGTAWEVSDEGAITFAKTLYDKLLNGDTIGAAVRTARNELYTARKKYDALWAAYQHYGDPNTTFFDEPGPEPLLSPAAAPARSRRRNSEGRATKRRVRRNR